MSATIIDGKKIAGEIKQELATHIKTLQNIGMQLGLAVIIVGNDPASQIYVNHKKKTCEELGMQSFVHALPEIVTQEEILELIHHLNNDPAVQGILVQLPLPSHLDKYQIVETISPAKDVDCFHPYNFGLMALGEGHLAPCTPAGIIELLKRYQLPIAGQECVIVGRSNLVGKPLAFLLQQENATVTMCHSRTRDLVSVCKRADILVAAVGKERLITKEMVKPGAVVIDVGTNRSADGSLVGDVDFASVQEVAGHITPVPGGVGPMTIAMLMKNVVLAAEHKK